MRARTSVAAPASAAVRQPGIADPTRKATRSHGEMAFAACDQPVGRTLCASCVTTPVARPAPTTSAARPIEWDRGRVGAADVISVKALIVSRVAGVVVRDAPVRYRDGI